MDIFEKQQKIDIMRGIVKARWFFIAVIFALGLALKIGQGKWAPSFSYFKIALMLVFALSYNFACLYFSRRPVEKISDRALKTALALQIVIEQIIYTLIYYYAGTVESTAFLLYVITILVASSFFRVKGLVLSGLLAIFLYSGVVIADYRGWVPHMFSIAGNTWFGNPLVVQVHIISFIFFIAAAVLFSAFLSNLIRRRELVLSQQRDQLIDQSAALIKQAKELAQAKNELAKMNEELEKKVEARTKELSTFNEMAVGRELKMIELKAKIKALEKENRELKELKKE